MRGPYTIAFEVQASGLAEHDYPLIAECLHMHLNVIICTHSQSDINFLRQTFQTISGAEKIQYYCFDDEIPFNEIDVIYSNMPGNPGILLRHPDSPVDIPRIAASHGLTDKKCKFPYESDRHPLGYFNTLFATGPLMFKGSWTKYIERYPNTETSLKKYDIGSPKSDSLFTGIYDRNEILESIGLDPSLKTVIYSPTYQKEASLETNGKVIIETLAQMNINVIVRLHHCSLELDNYNAASNGHDGKNWHSIMSEFEQQYSNVKHVKGDSNPYFVASDCLVGDVSGACYEFMLQDKPLVFINCPDYFDAYGKEGIGYCGRAAGIIVDDLEELEQAIKVSFRDDPKLETRGKLIYKLVYNRGRASLEALKTILDLLEGKDGFPVWGPIDRLNQDKDISRQFLEQLEKLNAEKIAIYGVGQDAISYLPPLLNSTRTPEVSYFLDDYPPASGKLFGLDVLEPCKINTLPDSIVIFNERHAKVMKATCNKLYGESIPIISIYDEVQAHA